MVLTRLSDALSISPQNYHISQHVLSENLLATEGNIAELPSLSRVRCVAPRSRFTGLVFRVSTVVLVSTGSPGEILTVGVRVGGLRVPSLAGTFRFGH